MSIYNISFSVKISFLVQHNRDGQSYLAYAFLKVVGLDNAGLAQPTRELPVSYNRTIRRQGISPLLSFSVPFATIPHRKILGDPLPQIHFTDDYSLLSPHLCTHPWSCYFGVMFKQQLRACRLGFHTSRQCGIGSHTKQCRGDRNAPNAFPQLLLKLRQPSKQKVCFHANAASR